MHELSLAMSILDLASEEAERQGGGTVAAIHLRIGPLSGVVPEALRSAFELAREGSDLRQAELMIEDVPLIVYCAVCTEERTLASVALCCPVCGGPTPKIVCGREMELVALEIET
jgi:hydrogenase nickel incorporation protein HypA/HybF